ncbi:hypothetical protein A1F96_11391 [Pyrenophora tritici-repentis]|uniref:Uncharacterized protein n=2 Tax=Pyrenophora tritici-repentis TaxID=45151 RepID=A0A922N6N0_9PLEO|nr:uncharacterized protein PTRG_04871 [Pyrenophora tritici-repentis Pt-1C-BFP]EDU47778.1 hypothetical protein PTRG_04871 [Pyrenophora tritici-repentis Pt-1C-BFP]KAI1510441.1 hypothetical protein Ptr86124_010887 [Pyrenophora tritici-repentis]KAI1668454.1 hypothetical protein L13192_07590 [Pyrenophora tritici-repentis]PZD22165.1 hypothetical protein A1F96_11391 [Pyrenophora tritici-repentis]
MGEVTLPVGLSIAAVSPVFPLSNIADPAVTASRRVLDGEKTQFVMPGERICALQYCKISYRWLHSRNIENLRLSDVPQWTAKESWRKASVDEAKYEPDILEVETVELKQLEGDWYREEGEGGDILLMQSVEERDEF